MGHKLFCKQLTCPKDPRIVLEYLQKEAQECDALLGGYDSLAGSFLAAAQKDCCKEGCNIRIPRLLQQLVSRAYSIQKQTI